MTEDFDTLIDTLKGLTQTSFKRALNRTINAQLNAAVIAMAGSIPVVRRVRH